MGLMDYLKTQFLEIIQWQDDSRDTISFRYPDLDKEIKDGAQLIVRESQVAQFVYRGQFVNTRLFTGNKWGTANPIMMRDADLGIVRARAYGIFDFHVTDVKLFLKEVA